jgi:GrpB-like predicted nucleotidyltransferase (UPF0157 family)
VSAHEEDVLLSAYSPMWPVVFEIEKERLARILGETVAIEHIGSTAVPDLGAKPIIDILIGAPDLATIEDRIEDLVADGYRYVPEFEKSIPERRYFTKERGNPGHFHLHAVVRGNPFWKRHLAFRDALRADPALAVRYWNLKKQLAGKYRNDRAAYTDAKSTFIRNVIDKAGG